MEAFVYTVYMLGLLAAFSVLVVRVLAALPVEVLIRGEHGGRYADLAAAAAGRATPQMADAKLTDFEVTKARAA
jgi:hypothetical protein